MLGTDCEDCGPRMPVVNPCDAEPCGTTGFCSEVEAEEPGDPMYECDCVTGWSGFLCDVDIDECLSLPCRNGGACTGTAAGVPRTTMGPTRFVRRSRRTAPTAPPAR